MTVVKEPVKIHTNVPKPIVAPSFTPRQPVEVPAEAVPVGAPKQQPAT